MVYENIIKIISKHTNISADSIDMDTNLQEDLQLDSIDAFEIMSEVEDIFDIEIDDEVLEDLFTVSDIVKKIQELTDEE